MNTTIRDCSALLARIRQDAKAASREVEALHGAEINDHRLTIQATVRSVLDGLEARAQECCPGNETCQGLVRHLRTYVDWLQWSLWDLPHLAVALKLDASTVRAGVASCGMIYLSMRLFDDVIDRHHTYKHRGDTLLALSHRTRKSNQSADALAILAAILLCFEGLGALADGDDARLAPTFRALTKSARRAALGAIMELSAPEEWSRDYYERLVVLKNVDFWRTLYAGFDPEGSSPLLPVLQRYYALAQKVNDVQDYIDDEQRAQPNLIGITRAELGLESDSWTAGGSLRAVELEVANDILEIWDEIATLPPREQLIARAKLGDALSDAVAAGLFDSLREQPAPPAVTPPTAAGLEWYADVSEVVGRFGIDALVERDCAVCGKAERRFLFKKQGFSFHRCVECSHVYVTPRARSEISALLGEELDAADHESALLDVQKLTSTTICTLLRARAPGSRLLDVGFGRGYIIELARTYGFDTYGVEASAAQIEALHDAMGRRLHRHTADDEALPWGAFDAVVMSHVLEHVDEPSNFLKQVHEALNPDGVLYVAVPDMDSTQFRLFGKNWEPVSPLAHLQYFNHASLKRLLSTAGFKSIERVDHVPIPDEIAPRWMRLLRNLGGSDSGELALLARKPAL